MIKNIIFDLGGVILEVDYHKTGDAFRRLGVSNFDELYSQHKASPLFQDLETGRVTAAQFCAEFCRITGHSYSETQIRQAWNAMLGHFPPHRLRWLEELRRRYRIFLYSNTNAIHYEAFQQLFREQSGGRNFDDLFEKAYYSHILGHRKPLADGFRLILKENRLSPAETLFIDDTEENLQGAAEAGMLVLWLPKGSDVTEIKMG